MTDGRPVALDLRYMEDYLPVWGQRWCPSKDAQQSSEWTQDSFQAISNSQPPSVSHHPSSYPVSHPPNSRVGPNAPGNHPNSHFRHGRTGSYTSAGPSPADKSRRKYPLYLTSTSNSPSRPFSAPHLRRPRVSNDRPRSVRLPEPYPPGTLRGQRLFRNDRGDESSYLTDLFDDSESRVEPNMDSSWPSSLYNYGLSSEECSLLFSSGTPYRAVQPLEPPSYQTHAVHSALGNAACQASDFTGNINSQVVSHDAAGLSLDLPALYPGSAFLPDAQTAYSSDVTEPCWDVLPGVVPSSYNDLSGNGSGNVVPQSAHHSYPSIVDPTGQPLWDEQGVGVWDRPLEHVGPPSTLPFGFENEQDFKSRQVTAPLITMHQGYGQSVDASPLDHPYPSMHVDAISRSLPSSTLQELPRAEYTAPSQTAEYSDFGLVPNSSNNNAYSQSWPGSASDASLPFNF